MRSKNQHQAETCGSSPATERRTKLRRWLDQLLPNRRENPRRGKLLLESLESRQLLAGDVDLLATDSTNDDVATQVPILEVVGEAQGEPAPDLVAFAQALADEGVEFYGGAWCPACTEQKELFQDGSDELPFTDVTEPDRSFGDLAASLNVTTLPTWEFPDGTRLEGVQSLQTLSERSGIEIPLSETPTFETVGNQQVRIGSPLHLPIDVYDPDGGAQTVTISVDDPTVVEAVVLSGNRSIRIDMATYGDMVFELFEQRAPRASGRVIELAESGFYDGLIFHRVVDNFVIQGGDPTGTGAGGSNLGDFDDEYHPDLQHNGSGVLSYAKSGDDTNDSQFFITEGDTRFLDFNHSIFGHIVEGEDVREEISGHAVNNPTENRPTTPIQIESISVFNDTENSVIMLKALSTTPGDSTNVTITVTDPDGNSHSEQITVDVVADVANSQPFLDEINLPSSFSSSADAEIQLTATDIEGDTVEFFGEINALDAANASINVDENTGLVTVTPNDGFSGSVRMLVGVHAEGVNRFALNAPFDTQNIVVDFETDTVNAPTELRLLAGTDTGSSNIDGVTNAGTLTFSVEGTTTGAQVEIVNVATGDNIGIGLATGSSLAISTNNLAALPDATYTLAARQTIDGVTSDLSPSIIVQFDSTAPSTVSSSAVLTANVGRLYQSDLISSEEGAGLRYELVSGPEGASIDSATGIITWTPTIDQVGTNSFDLELTDLAGNITPDTFDVEVAEEPLLDLTVTLLGEDGNEVSFVDVGDRFTLRVDATDARDILNRNGIFSAHTDVTFDNTLIRPVPGATIVHGPDFDTFLPAGTIQNGLIDEVGGTVTATQPTNKETSLLFTLEMEAIAAGTANIRLDAPEERENLLFRENRQLPAEAVGFGNAILAIGQGFLAADDTFTVAEDSGPTELDVLANDQTSNSSTVLSIISVTQPNDGTVTLNSGAISFTPDPDFAGTTTFTYRVSDDGGIQATATVTMTVTGVNDPPVGNADVFSVDQNSVNNTLDVLANDSFAPDLNEVLTITDVTTSDNGSTITIASGGDSIVYTPATDFAGTDSFEYILSDGATTVTVPVTVTVAPADPPPTANDDAFTITEDAVQDQYDVTENDTTDDSGQTFVIDSVGSPSNGGTASISGDGSELVYQPAADFFGTETVTYTIRDTGGGLDFGTATFTVEAVNDPPPVADRSVSLNRSAGQSTVLTISDLPSNVDGDGETLAFENLGTPSAGGAVEIDSSGAILYTPPSDTFTGEDTFTFSVSDGSGLTSSGTVTVTVNDFDTRDIALSFVDDRFEFNGLVIQGTDALGAAVSQPISRADDAYFFADLLPGDYQINIPEQPLLIGGEAAQTIAVISAPEDGDTTIETNLGRLRPEFVSIRDFLGSASRETVLVAVAPGLDSVMSATSPSTTSISSPTATLDSSGEIVTLTGTDDTGASVEAVLNATDNAAVDLRGTSGDLRFFKIDVQEGVTDFSSVSDAPAQGELIDPVEITPSVAPAAVSSELVVSDVSPESEQVAAAASSRVDAFVPAADDLAGASSILVTPSGQSENLPVEDPALDIASDDSTGAVDVAFQSVSPRLRLLASATDQVAESGENDSESNRETAIDAVLTTEI